MIIREFNSKDLNNCAKIFVEVFNKEPWNDQWTLSLAIDYFQDVLNTPGFIGFVLEDDISMCGFVFGTRKKWWSGNIYYLYEMCVDPGNQGQGIGTKLLEGVKQSLNEKGYSAIVLLTERTFPAAHFYEKQGFIECPQTRFYVCGL